jgi:hypothetical protein
MTRAHVRLLGPCFKTGRIGGRLSHRDGARTRWDATRKRRRRQVARDRPRRHRRTTPPVPLARRLTRVTPPKIVLMTGEDTEPEGLGHYPIRRITTATLSAHTDGKCTVRHQTPRDAASEDRVAPRTDGNRMNAAEFRQLYPLPSKRFHALLNSLFKVLCNFPSRYLFAIGLVAVFSLR